MNKNPLFNGLPAKYECPGLTEEQNKALAEETQRMAVDILGN